MVVVVVAAFGFCARTNVCAWHRVVVPRRNLLRLGCRDTGHNTTRRLNCELRGLQQASAKEGELLSICARVARFQSAV